MTDLDPETLDLYVRVALAYRDVRVRGGLDHPAFLAARAVYIEETGDQAGARTRVPFIIHWGAENIPHFWKGVHG
jgi:hypothetical protein